MGPAATNLADQISHLTTRLTDDFASKIDPQEVKVCVQEALDDLGTPKVTIYVPVLVEKAARRHLRELVAA